MRDAGRCACTSLFFVTTLCRTDSAGALKNARRGESTAHVLEAILSKHCERVLGCVALLLALLLFSPPVARAQDPEPANQVFSALVGSGYDVVEVGFLKDAQGSPDKNSVYAEMETVTSNLDDRYVLNQMLGGFDALAKYYPNAQNLVVVLKYDRWLFFLITTAQDWDDLVSRTVKGADFLAKVKSQLRIYDLTQQKYITAKDFTSQNQTNKNQTNKDFTGNGPAPLPPVNTNPDAQAENILLEPSTTYLPADGAAQGLIMATLTDREFSGLPGRGVNFTYEVRGQDEKALGVAQTDPFGTARSKIASSRVLGDVLLRAATSSLNASTQLIVGAAPGDDTDAQAQAVMEGLKGQGYREVDAAYSEYTGPAGNKIRVGVAAVRVTSNAFDRQVYSQLSRMMGTVRTVMKNATILRPILLFAAADGHDYALLFTLRTEIWDAYVRGDIGENQLWASLAYEGAVDENGVRTNDKNFLGKNFTGVKQTRYSSAQRETASTLTTETWGEQLTVGSFLVPVGGYADTFNVTEMSGSATGFELFETPDYNNPIFTFRRGDDAALQNLRLDSGQYVLSVQGASAPAQVNLTYTEHLGR